VDPQENRQDSGTVTVGAGFNPQSLKTKGGGETSHEPMGEGYGQRSRSGSASPYAKDAI